MGNAVPAHVVLPAGPVAPPVPFNRDLREDHMYYATIMALLVAAASYLLAWHLGSDKSGDVTEGWYCLLATSIFLNLSGILGILIASCHNYERVADANARFWHKVGHSVLIAATACALVGSILALFRPDI